jgi:4-amino-4-deoxy-L-arabinose transferase-like glycosyltransferase
MIISFPTDRCDSCRHSRENIHSFIHPFINWGTPFLFFPTHNNPPQQPPHPTQLDGKIHATWWAVFTPLWLFFAGQLLGICAEYALAARLKDSLGQAAVAAGRDPEAPLPAEEEVRFLSCLGFG